MNRLAQGGLTFFLGLVVVQMTTTGVFTNYVKPGLEVPLQLAGAVLVVLGLGTVLRWVDDPRRRRRQDEATGGHGHDHSRGPRVGWLLVLPVLALTVVRPPALGADAAARDDGLVAADTGDAADASALAAGEEVTDISVAQFQYMAAGDPDRLEQHVVRLEGFASPADDGGWFVTRMALSCCAADGFAVKVRVDGAPSPGDDVWVSVTGRFTPVPGVDARAEPPTIAVEEPGDVVVVDPPQQPYL